MDDCGTLLLCIPQCSQHSRMIGARVLPNHHDDIGHVEIIKRNGSFTDADGLNQSLAARFMAHVGAIGEVVGPVRPNKGLVEKCRLVARAT